LVSPPLIIIFYKLTQVATFKILDSLTPLLNGNNLYFASICSANCMKINLLNR